ncbi:MAG TPA: hypothetical protein VGF44_13575 [Terriglobales bacterium]
MDSSGKFAYVTDEVLSAGPHTHTHLVAHEIGGSWHRGTTLHTPRKFGITHGGFRSVIGDILNDRVTRTAVRTVSEWVSKSAIRGIGKILETILATRDIRRNQSKLTVDYLAFFDFKIFVTERFQSGCGHFFDLHQLWRLANGEQLRKSSTD